MNDTDPIAFLSYVRADDDHERGRITALRMRLEGEVRMQTGRPFAIFQDKKDVLWGQQWRERLDSELFNVTFLIPIITPSYFRSSACRDEFEKFAIREKQLGKDTLILPIYYLESDEINEAGAENPDGIAAILLQRNWADWRSLRFTPIEAPEVEQSIAQMARTIKTSMKSLESEIRASDEQHKQPTPPTPPPETSYSLDMTDYSPEIPEMLTPGGTRKPSSIRSAYYAYTKAHDEIIGAEELIDNDSEIKHRALISRKTRALKKGHSGPILEARSTLKSLAITNPPVVIFLVDNSGSLREEDRIPLVAAWLQVIVEVLEEAAIPSEILGFTTRAWKGGESREKWLANGRPSEPGRLNDLRHIIYKGAERGATDTHANLGLMASGRLLKENIDGEALLWAYDRSREIGQSRTIIIMISDGAPVDDSTLSVNPGYMLEKHLLSTIKWMSGIPALRLYGVGLEFDTSRYYADGIPKTTAKALGVALLKELPMWLSEAD
ncbi:cobaltochelatase CobT-related protein [Neorhizobium sp. DAR64861/K0K2]|uniref:cobaltochelatase CobT-related protein n=1 Tax=unclassified Neorhizobium TaxID=2629175 RepID=UPI003D2A8D0C